MKTTGLLLLVCSVLFLSFMPLVDGSHDYQKEAALARQFLVRLYDDDVGLVKESPLLQRNYFGLQSDNYLARA